jgi:predicted nuclease with TOPRIM domain
MLQTKLAKLQEKRAAVAQKIKDLDAEIAKVREQIEKAETAEIAKLIREAKLSPEDLKTLIENRQSFA